MRQRHGRKCPCPRCVGKQLLTFKDRLALMNGVPPPSARHTIPVRPHWRYNRNHLKFNPALRALVRDIVITLRREKRSDGATIAEDKLKELGNG